MSGRSQANRVTFPLRPERLVLTGVASERCLGHGEPRAEAAGAKGDRALRSAGLEFAPIEPSFQAACVEMIGGADAELDSYEMAAAGELPPYPPPERPARIVCGCARTLSDMFHESKDAVAGKEWFEHIGSMLGQPDFLPPYETPDDEKMRGLYADLGRTSGQPMNVTHMTLRRAVDPKMHPLRALTFASVFGKSRSLGRAVRRSRSSP